MIKKTKIGQNVQEVPGSRMSRNVFALILQRNQLHDLDSSQSSPMDTCHVRSHWQAGPLPIQTVGIRISHRPRRLKKAPGSSRAVASEDSM